jgi:PAS domain S-box-containing protein
MPRNQTQVPLAGQRRDADIPPPGQAPPERDRAVEVTDAALEALRAELVRTNEQLGAAVVGLDAAVEQRAEALHRAVDALTRERAERRRAEEALGSSEERFRLLFDQTFDLLTLIDTDRHMVDANEALCRALGYSRDEARRMTVDDLHPAEEMDKIHQAIERVLANGRDHMGRTVFLSKDGRRIPVDAGAVIVELAAGRHVLASFRDVTEQDRAERDREALIAELEEKNAELERFTYTASHDLKAPLITIQGFLAHLAEEVRDGELAQARADIERIQAGAEKMSKLLDGLLELSRVGRIAGAPAPVSLGELARDAAELLAGRIDQRGADVRIADDLPVVYGDRPRLLEVYQNLIENAVRYLGDQPRPVVEVGVRRNAAEEVLYVRDNGIGIDPAHHERIFGLFSRLNPDGAGTGIGLALAQRVVQVHGGKLWVESEGRGRGSTFCFTLPGERSGRRGG